MTLVRTSGPDAEPVTVSSLKAYLRLTHDSEDELLAGLIRAAREDVERATGLVLLGQEWRLVLDAWPDSGTAFSRIVATLPSARMNSMSSGR